MSQSKGQVQEQTYPQKKGHVEIRKDKKDNIGKSLFLGCFIKKRILLGLVVYLDFSLYLFISSYKYNVVMKLATGG